MRPSSRQDPHASPKAKPTRLPAPEAQLMAGRWRAGAKEKMSYYTIMKRRPCFNLPVIRLGTKKYVITLVILCLSGYIT